MNIYLVALLLLSCFSRVQLCATPQTAAHQAPQSDSRTTKLLDHQKQPSYITDYSAAGSVLAPKHSEKRWPDCIKSSRGVWPGDPQAEGKKHPSCLSRQAKGGMTSDSLFQGHIMQGLVSSEVTALFFFFNWSIVDSPWCVSFYCTAK